MDELQQLKEQVAELMEWKQQREVVQLSYPVDDTSRQNLRAITTSGSGSHPLTQNITVPVGGSSFNVPAAFTGTIFLETSDGRKEIPYY